MNAMEPQVIPGLAVCLSISKALTWLMRVVPQILGFFLGKRGVLPLGDLGPFIDSS